MECVTLDTLGAKAPFSKTEPDSFVGFNNYFTKEQKSKLAKEEKLANLRKTRAIQKKNHFPPTSSACSGFFFLFKVKENLIREKCRSKVL